MNPKIFATAAKAAGFKKKGDEWIRHHRLGEQRGTFHARLNISGSVTVELRGSWAQASMMSHPLNPAQAVNPNRTIYRILIESTEDFIGWASENE